ncbi:MAG: cellulose synthase/poly-beta-1,6-N-acetylglucosamine synthase-like glycosyltransferase, partial [Candidatus Marinamargulisbacteria bacterium]
MISIIVPVYQEHPEEVRHLVRELLSKNGESVEIIVVDGDPEKGSLGMLQGLTVKRVAALPGRGGQMNAGAQVATGDVLLFLHADSVL